MHPEYAARIIEDAADASAALSAVLTEVAAGDFDAAGRHFTEDAVLVIHGFPRMNGRWEGRGVVVEAMRQNFGSVCEQRPVIEAKIQSGNTAAILFREEGCF